MKLPQVFKMETTKTDIDDVGYLVTLAPQISQYTATLDYDGAGNANVTITRKADNKVMLDFFLDNGEINDIDDMFNIEEFTT